jgi:hypothetical protein
MRMDERLIISSGTALHSIIIARNDSIYHSFTVLLNGTSHVYSDKDLDKIISTIRKFWGDEKMICHNNDHGMLESGLYLLKLDVASQVGVIAYY